MSLITFFDDIGVSVEAVGQSIKISGLSRLSPEQKDQVIEYAKTHKAALLMAMDQTSQPGECESCPAAGYWDHGGYAGQGLLCFYSAYFLCKAGTPQPCGHIRVDCPRKEKDHG